MIRCFRNALVDGAGMVSLAAQCLRLTATGRVKPSLVAEQIFIIGVRSVGVTILMGLFVGATMAIQIEVQLRDFGATSFLGGLASSVSLRNVGPVLIGFLLAGKVGAYMSAEIGAMRVSDQIDALRCLGVDPIGYLVAPRFMASLVSSVVLLMIGLVMTVLGGMLMADIGLNVNYLSYIQRVQDLVSVSTLCLSVLKSLTFGAILSAIACYRGYNATGGFKGVGRAVRQTSVEALVMILLMDLLLSDLWSGWVNG